MQYLRLIPNYYYYHYYHYNISQRCFSFNKFHIRALMDKSIYTIRPTNARILNTFITHYSLPTILNSYQKPLHAFISVISQLYAQNFCFTILLFHASACFEHMCSKHAEA